MQRFYSLRTMINELIAVILHGLLSSYKLLGSGGLRSFFLVQLETHLGTPVNKIASKIFS